MLWNKLKVNKKLKVNSKLNVEEFESHFRNLTTDNKPLNEDQLRIQTAVVERSSNLSRISYMPFKCTECDFCECSGCVYVAKDNYCYTCRHRENLNGHVRNITREDILNAIKYLKKGTSPG